MIYYHTVFDLKLLEKIDCTLGTFLWKEFTTIFQEFRIWLFLRPLMFWFSPASPLPTGHTVAYTEPTLFTWLLRRREGSWWGSSNKQAQPAGHLTIPPLS